MKKLFLAGAVALMGAVTVNAQAKFGVKAGYALSNISSKADGKKQNLDAKSTFYVGGLVEYKFADKMAIQGELVYAPLGAKNVEKFEEAGYYVEAITKVNLNTLSVPVSFKYYVTPELAFNGGVGFGFILDANSDIDYETNVPNVSDDVINNALQEELGVSLGKTDLNDKVRKLNLAPFVGAEYNLSNGLFFDARYNFGVSNLEKEDNKDVTTTNSFLQVGLGYKF